MSIDAATLMKQVSGAKSQSQRVACFQAILDSVPKEERDAWFDSLFGFDALAEDGPDLPKGCVPYLPCSVEILLRMFYTLDLCSDDVFVDIGAGQGRVAALVHLLTDAATIGIEVQSNLVRRSREKMHALGMERVLFVHGDAVDFVKYIPNGTVFFLYAPFSGARFECVMNDLEFIAAARTIRLCCVQVASLNRSWLKVAAQPVPELVIYQSVCQSA